MSDEHQVCPMCHDDMCDGDCENYMDAKDRTIATLTAERDEQLRLNQIGHEREAALMTDSLLKADEIKWLKAKLHLAVADLDKARRERDALVEAVRNLERAWENATYHDVEDTSPARSELFELLAQLKEQPNG